MKVLLLLSFLLISLLRVDARPQQYFIQGVPYHHQITDYGCGDASLEMVCIDKETTTRKIPLGYITKYEFQRFFIF
jgi:hypothetical protein